MTVRKIVFIRKNVRKLIALSSALMVTSAFSQSSAVTVVEFYNKPLDAYFISGRLAEQQTLDASSDFRRTGMTFAATAASAPEAGAKRICRFYIQLASPPTSSHFYGREGVDCAQIQAQNLSGFNYEGFDFAIAEPTGGVCPTGTTTVYRGFRRAAGGKTPNHRYTTSPETYIVAQAAGYAPESAAFCAVTATDVVPTVASTQKCGTFYYPGQRITYQSLASDGTPGSFQRFLNKTTTTFNGRSDATAVEERYAASPTQLNVIIDGATTWTALGTSSTDSAGVNEIYYSNPTVYPKDFAVSQAIPINRQLTYSRANGFGTVTQTGSLIYVGKEGVTVPLGTDDSACKFVTQLVTTYSGTGQKVTSVTTNWISDGVGILKTIADVQTESTSAPAVHASTTTEATFVQPF